MSLVGIPSLFLMFCGVIKMISAQSRRIKILMDAQQAQMRRNLTGDFYKYKERGRISQRDLDDWVAQYDAYHALGANGVLDSIRDKMLNLEMVKDED